MRRTSTTWCRAPPGLPGEEGFGKPDERVVITAGVPLRTPGKTNLLRVARIGLPGSEAV